MRTPPSYGDRNNFLIFLLKKMYCWMMRGSHLLKQCPGFLAFFFSFFTETVTASANSNPTRASKLCSATFKFKARSSQKVWSPNNQLITLLLTHVMQGHNTLKAKRKPHMIPKGTFTLKTGMFCLHSQWIFPSSECLEITFLRRDKKENSETPTLYFPSSVFKSSTMSVSVCKAC